MAEYELDTLDESPVAQSHAQIAPGEIVLGTLAAMDAEGRPLVDYPSNPTGQPITALSTVSVTRAQLSRQVAILFANGNMSCPVIIGFIHSPLFSLLENFDALGNDAREVRNEAEQADTAGNANQLNVAHVDGTKVVIEGKNEVVLKCGDASITLTRAGKILIRGKYLLNRSSGVNRIMGGSVQVN